MLTPDSKTSNPKSAHRSLRDIAQAASGNPPSEMGTSASAFADLRRDYLHYGGGDSLRGFRNQFGVFMPLRLVEVAGVPKQFRS
jgi:hypothetical protein